MNTGQMMLVIGAFAMLSTLSLSINGMITTTLSLGFEAELALNAHAIAQSMLDEVLTKSFDEKTLTKKIYNRADLSSVLRPDFGEGFSGIDTTYLSKSKFDDVDDYHTYQRKVRNSLGWEFLVSDTVEYVDEDSPNVVSGTQTFVKRISVYVSHPNMRKDNAGSVIPVVMRDLAVYRRYF